MSDRYPTLVSLVTLWHVAASTCYYAVFAGAPLFRDAFSLSGVSVGFVLTALTLGYAVFLLPLGAATDRFGERRTLTAGLLCLAAGVALAAVAPTYGLLLVAAFGLGSAYGAATPGTNKAVFDNVDPARHHRAIGIKQVGPTAGSAVGSLLVTGLAFDRLPRTGFLVAAAVGVATAALFYAAYPDARTTDASYPDVRGLLAERPYRLLAAAGVCFGAVFYTTTGYVVLYVEASVGAAVAVGGAVLAAVQVASSVGRVAAGRLGDALPGGQTARLGGLLAGQALCGSGAFFLLPLATTPVGTGAVFGLVGLFALGSLGLYYSLLSTVVADDAVGSASAGGQLAATLGGLAAPPAFGYVAETAGYATGWRLVGAVSLLGVGLVAAVALAAR